MKNLLVSLALAASALTLSSAAYAHGCHGSVANDAYGWHRHAPDCDRIQTHRDGDGDVHRPHHDDDDDRPRYRRYDYDDAPRCANVKRCHYIGPFKECKWVQECRY